MYLHLLVDVLHRGQILFFGGHVETFVVLNKYFGVLCFVEWVFVFTCKFCFVKYLKTCQFIFHIMDVYKVST